MGLLQHSPSALSVLLWHTCSCYAVLWCIEELRFVCCVMMHWHLPFVAAIHTSSTPATNCLCFSVYFSVSCHPWLYGSPVFWGNVHCQNLPSEKLNSLSGFYHISYLHLRITNLDVKLWFHTWHLQTLPFSMEVILERTLKCTYSYKGLK